MYFFWVVCCLFGHHKLVRYLNTMFTVLTIVFNYTNENELYNDSFLQ